MRLNQLSSDTQNPICWPSRFIIHGRSFSLWMRVLMMIDWWLFFCFVLFCLNTGNSWTRWELNRVAMLSISIRTTVLQVGFHISVSQVTLLGFPVQRRAEVWITFYSMYLPTNRICYFHTPGYVDAEVMWWLFIYLIKCSSL